MFSAGTHVPRITSQPASARHLEMAQPKPWSSATPATKAFLPGCVRVTGREAREKGQTMGGRRRGGVIEVAIERGPPAGWISIFSEA